MAAIPQGYMTVGEVAKKMGVTVRTLQYYDREGLLAPTAESEGGRRLYTGRDVVKLHQILSLKHLGFSLDDIKNRLASLDTPADVAQALARQADALRVKMEALAESLREIEMLRAEVLQMQTVDFGKYADIIVNLQMKNEMYWAIKLLDDTTLDQLRSHFDRESGQAFLEAFQDLCGQALQYQKDRIAPESEQGQELARQFWEMLMEFTGGDMKMFSRLMAVGGAAAADGAQEQSQTVINAYLGPALGAYFDSLGYNPMEGAK